MKPKTSTTTSVHTGIDDSKEYYFMSGDLENEIDLEQTVTKTSKFIDLRVGDKLITRNVVSIEDAGESFVVCLADQDAISRFLPMMLECQTFTTSVCGVHFNCRVLKVEQDRCYLRAVR